MPTVNLLFDLDGTLTDPKQGILACIRYSLARLEIDINPEVRLESFIGPPLRDSFRSLCADEDMVETAVSFYRERFSSLGLYENEVYEGIPQSLARLRDCVDSIYVATSKPAIYARRIIEHFELDCFFDAVYGSELDGRLGDKTELIGHIQQRERLDADDTIMIGDRSFDVIGARNNRVRSIGVLWGYGSRAELEQAGANRLCRHPEGLQEVLA